ncbi:MAG: hypothetical protein HOK98_14785 [Rhodospirillaceae bacterium]|nr:hypothetical protein [Rhodospirillaceae bacterium]
MKFSNLAVSLGAAAIAALFISDIASAQNPPTEPFDWRDDWELAEGLDMTIDSEGYNFPSHMIFVEKPGPGPKDPLYFVLELKGKIKVVTNDRSVHTFASDVLPIPQGPNSFDQVGLTGVCLNPENGYVFVTFAYLDETQIYRNGMARYSTTPGTFGLEGTDRLELLDVFRPERSATAHQIGPCQVDNGYVYTAVGYGDEKAQAQNLHSTLGSIIRTDLDLKPSDDNPFFEDDGKTTAIDYIWAYGFRNPFGLKMVDGRLFATENGGDVDRFNEIEEGENYLWNGTDWSIGARASQTFTPSVGLVHLDYIDEDNEVFPEDFRGNFVTVSSGTPGEVGRSVDGKRSLLLLQYDFDTKQMASVPRSILNYRGTGMQIPVSTAVGPDGLYFLPILPNAQGTVAVFKVSADPNSDYPHRIGSDETPLALINQYGCRQCHKITGAGGSFGPALDDGLRDRLFASLNDPAYAARVAEVDKLDGEPFVNFRDARQNILEASSDERVRRWLETYLQEPTFDNPKNRMPRLDVTPAHAAIIGEHLTGRAAVTSEPEFGTLDKVRFFIAAQVPELRYRHMILSFGIGGLLGGLVLLIIVGMFRRRRAT